jgi:uroporphyrinogen decarboxylase
MLRKRCAMTPKEKFIMALEGKQPPGRVPHFELVFYLTMEALGRLHPRHRNFSQWDQMSKAEQDLQIRDMADVSVEIARWCGHSAIFFTGPMDWANKLELQLKVMDQIREISGQTYYTMMHGDSTYEVPPGSKIVEFSMRIADDPQGVKDEAQQMVDRAIARAERIKKAGTVDGFAMCSDYCLNTGPFLSPAMFDEFIQPYLAKTIAAYREMGFYTIKHTDGNIMPILDALVAAKPHAIHSLDPQGGIDIAEIKKLVGKKVCLIGNVNCGLMDTGTDQEVIESARYALKHGMPGGGYIFSTSNCVYTGMKLERYKLMLEVWKTEGNYE